MSSRVCRVSLVLLAGWSAAFAQPLVQELLRSDVVYPQEKQEFQVTFAPVWSPRQGHLRTPLSVEYGLTKSWQLGMRVDGALPKSRTAAESLAFDIRRSFVDLRGSGLHLAAGLEAEIDRSQQSDANHEAGAVEREGHSRLEYGSSIVIAKDILGARGQLFCQLELGLTATGRPVEHRYAAGGLLRTGPVVLTHEFTWSAVSGPHTPARESYWVPGVVWRLPAKPAWELAGGVSFGLGPRTEPFSIILKLTHEFESIRSLPQR